MSDFTNSELRRLDLTLLLVFLGLIRHRKAAAVAADLGLTQSAISQAMRRLRDIFDDELFLRRPHGMEPTAAALALEAPVAAAVEALRGALGVARSFEPESASGTLRIAAFDSAQAVLIPQLAQRFRDRAPGLALSVLPLGREDAMHALSEGAVDIVLGYAWNRPDSVSAETIYTESYLVAGRPDLIPDAPRLSLDAYCAAYHVLVSPGGDLHGVVDHELEAIGRRRRVILGLPAFLPALAAVVSCDALVTLPARIVRSFASGFGLAMAAPPLAVRAYAVCAYWHRRNVSDPRTRWIVTQIREIAG